LIVASALIAMAPQAIAAPPADVSASKAQAEAIADVIAAGFLRQIIERSVTEGPNAPIIFRDFYRNREIAGGEIEAVAAKRDSEWRALFVSACQRVFTRKELSAFSAYLRGKIDLQTIDNFKTKLLKAEDPALTRAIGQYAIEANRAIADQFRKLGKR
jgi:hypothetical protein